MDNLESSTIRTEINARSAEFLENAQHMQSLVDDLHAQVEKIKQGGGERYQQRHIARGKLLPRPVREFLPTDPGCALYNKFLRCYYL